MRRIEDNGVLDAFLLHRRGASGILSVVCLLCLMIFAPSQAETCGWYGDGQDVDDDVIIVGADGKPLTDDNLVVKDPAEQTRIGNRFRKGDGVARNDKEALLWYRRAAEQGFAGAQNNIGNMYEKGMGVERDESIAAWWYREAANRGNAYAQHSLGMMHRDGRGVPQDDTKAAHWILKAANQGHRGAFRDIGTLYWKGLGVTRNDVAAYMWLKVAAMHGDIEGERLLRTVSAGMEPAAQAEAERMAQQWKPADD